MSIRDQKNSSRVNQLSLFIVLINCTVGLFVYFFLAHSLLLLAGIFTETLLAFVPIYLVRRGYYRRASFVLFMILAAASFFFSSMIGNATIANLMGAVLVASGGYFFNDRKCRIWSYLIAILVVWGIQENQVVGLIPEIKLEQPNYSRLLLTAYIVVVFLIFTLVGWFRRTIESPENARGNNFFSIALIQVRQLLVQFSITIRNKYKSLILNDIELNADSDNLNGMVENGPVVVPWIFKDVEDEYRRLARAKRVHLGFNVSAGFPEEIQSDKRMLRSIVAQLVKNAIQSSSCCTTVKVGAYITGPQLNIRVEHQGLGITQGMRSRLFEPGTDLYITGRLVLALGGTIKVVNKGTEGAMFIVSWLPPKTN